MSCAVTEITHTELDAQMPQVDLLVRSGLADGKGAARKLMEGGGIYVNGLQESNVKRQLSAADVQSGTVIFLRSGKNNHRLLYVEDVFSPSHKHPAGC